MATIYWGEPADPETRECDWCGQGSQAKFHFPVYREASQRSKGVRPAQFVYACEEHKDTAKRASEATAASRKAA